MGATCFMNTILQTLLHNPYLRAHYLSEKHYRMKCDNNLTGCLSCEIDDLFRNFHNGVSKDPYCPTSFLYNMWISRKALAGYAQQDAHEFFISLLDELHKNSKGKETSECDCIIHQTFGGIFQSNVKCRDCEAVSATFDPFLDISIDINSAIRKSAGASNVHTLYECLDGYTSTENLIQYNCKQCGSSKVTIIQY